MKIKIMKDGPICVSGDIPLYLKKIRPEGHTYELATVRRIETGGDYALCRCGQSKNHPFCDGAHLSSGFKGRETADKRPYRERAETIKGETLDILDDNRCAFARFCHREKGDAWTLTVKSGDEENRGEAIRGASECIAGRLTSVDKEGNMMEDALEPSVSLIQDPERGVSGGLYVTGYIPVESADGEEYERRNRITLCRCGHSTDKPFCDSRHVSGRFRDGLK